ncbi:VMAP-C domain-containing protein [Actinophytocola sp. KF-1]
MQSLPCLTSQQDRNFVVRLLIDRLGPLQIDESPRIGPHVLSIVEVCARRSDGLAALLDILGELDEGTIHMREVARIIAERDASELWPEEERERLFALLSGMIFKDLVDLYGQVAGLGAPELPAETTYRDVFATLESLNAEPDGLPKPVVFVEHLAKGRRPELANELRRWADRQANRLGVVTQLQALRRAFAAPSPGPPPGAPAYVVLLLRRTGLAHDTYQLSHWSQLDLSDGWHPERGEDVTGTLDEIKRRVAELIEDVETKWARFQPAIHIEAVLSDELLNLDIEQWSWEVESALPELPIGCRYVFAIRSLERMQKGQWHRPWHVRWSVLTGQIADSGAVERESVRWVAEGDAIRKLIVDFENNPNLVALVLREPPMGSAEISVGLRAGVPVVMWDREDGVSEEFLATVRHLLHNDESASVLQRIKHLRTTAYESHPGHIGHHLAVMWDDPERLVVPPGEVSVA